LRYRLSEDPKGLSKPFRSKLGCLGQLDDDPAEALTAKRDEKEAADLDVPETLAE